MTVYRGSAPSPRELVAEHGVRQIVIEPRMIGEIIGRRTVVHRAKVDWWIAALIGGAALSLVAAGSVSLGGRPDNRPS